MRFMPRSRLLLVSAAMLPVATLVAACGGDAAESTPVATTAAPRAEASAVATPSAAPTVQAFTETTKFEVDIGVPPAAGWKWTLGEMSAGAEAVSEPTLDHRNPWLFYTLAGSHEVSVASKAETFDAGKAIWLPSREPHGHRLAPQARVVAVHLMELPPGGRAHGADVLLASDRPLDLKAGTAAKLRVRELALAPGATLPESATAAHTAVYVVEGAIASRVGGVEQQVAAGKTVEWRPSVSHDARNTGPAPARLVVFDVRQ